MRAVIGLGSNLGDRHALLCEARERIGREVVIEKMSAIIETAPVGPPQPHYLNAAILVQTPHLPRKLMDLLLAIETSMGRVRTERWGPRTIDLDILWIDGVVVNELGLVIPHPELLNRAFAWEPLLELVPDAIDPRSGERFTNLLGRA